MEKTKTLLLEIALSLFNPKILPEAKLNIKELRSFYKDKGITYDVLLDLIQNNDSDEIGYSKLKSDLLLKANRSNAEVENLLARVMELRDIPNSEVEDYKYKLKTACYVARQEEAQRFYSDDPIKYKEYLDSYSYKDLGSATFQIKEVQDLDVTSLAETFLNNPIESSIDIINKSFSGHKGYLRGSLVMLIAPPKRGKSMLLMQEASHFVRTQKLKVHYLAIGDLNELDFIARMSAQNTETDLDVVYADLKTARNEFIKLLELDQPDAGRLSLTCLPAKTLSPTDYSQIAKSMLDEYDVLIIDYDYNFKDEVENMYERGGNLYNILAQIKTYKNQLILVASQPSKGWWSESYLDETCAGESSQKQMIIDAMVTMGGFRDSGTHCGWINVPLQRRGTSLDMPYIRTSDGRINEVPYEIVSLYSGDARKREISSFELKLLLKEYNLNKELT